MTVVRVVVPNVSEATLTASSSMATFKSEIASLIITLLLLFPADLTFGMAIENATKASRTTMSRGSTGGSVVEMGAIDGLACVGVTMMVDSVGITVGDVVGDGGDGGGTVVVFPNEGDSLEELDFFDECFLFLVGAKLGGLLIGCCCCFERLF